jgi:hypothetical protein
MQARFSVLVALMGAAVMVRLLPHPENFVPIGALALFSGSKLDRPGWAFGVPLAALVASDLVIGFHELTAWVYLAFVGVVALGRILGPGPGPARIAAGGLAGAVLFFLVTNLAVWKVLGTYAPTWMGLLECYLAGLGHFLRTLAGMAFYGFLLFGGLALLERRFPVLRTSTA